MQQKVRVIMSIMMVTMTSMIIQEMMMTVMMNIDQNIKQIQPNNKTSDSASIDKVSMKRNRRSRRNKLNMNGK